MDDRRSYFVYITTNVQRSVLYTGVTNNLVQRLWEHQQDASWLKKTFAGKYNCFNLIYWEHFQDIRYAIAREKEIKGWRRSKKEALIKEMNPHWQFLNDELA